MWRVIPQEMGQVLPEVICMVIREVIRGAIRTAIPAATLSAILSVIRRSISRIVREVIPEVPRQVIPHVVRQVIPQVIPGVTSQVMGRIARPVAVTAPYSPPPVCSQSRVLSAGGLPRVATPVAKESPPQLNHGRQSDPIRSLPVDTLGPGSILKSSPSGYIPVDVLRSVIRE
jgi:hypothetical protein